MFSFFKSKKTTLIDILPPNFVDIHSHILPGIDDGASTIEESIDLIKKMNAFGIQNFIITPHIMEGVWENTPTTIMNALRYLQEGLEKNGLSNIKVKAGAEYMLDHNFNELLSTKNLLPLKDNYILIEMSYLSPPLNLFETLFAIQIAGYIPVLAHPERYNSYHSNYFIYEKLKKAGCLFQLNLLSLSNYYGKEVQVTALKLLKNNMYDFVGTDIHHMRHLNYLEKITDKKTLKLVAPILENNLLFL